MRTISSALAKGAAAAAAAEAEFNLLFVQHALPDELPVHVVDPSRLSSFQPEDGSVLLAQALQAAGLVPSYSEGLRMLRQGAVTLDGERAGPERERIPCDRPWKVRVGKRRFAEIRFERS
jgi:tyrosyl-tRNA synthetase